MKHTRLRISKDDYLRANRKASREEEIRAHGKQISMRPAVFKSKKIYNRKRSKRLIFRCCFQAHHTAFDGKSVWLRENPSRSDGCCDNNTWRL